MRGTELLMCTCVWCSFHYYETYNRPKTLKSLGLIKFVLGLHLSLLDEFQMFYKYCEFSNWQPFGSEFIFC